VSSCWAAVAVPLAAQLNRVPPRVGRAARVAIVDARSKKIIIVLIVIANDRTARIGDASVLIGVEVTVVGARWTLNLNTVIHTVVKVVTGSALGSGKCRGHHLQSKLLYNVSAVLLRANDQVVSADFGGYATNRQAILSRQSGRRQACGHRGVGGHAGVSGRQRGRVQLNAHAIAMADHRLRQIAGGLEGQRRSVRISLSDQTKFICTCGAVGGRRLCGKTPAAGKTRIALHQYIAITGRIHHHVGRQLRIRAEAPGHVSSATSDHINFSLAVVANRDHLRVRSELKLQLISLGMTQRC
jgi:hypothetical protein